MPHPRHVSSLRLAPVAGAPPAPGPAGARRPRVVRDGPTGAVECPDCGVRLRFGPEPGATIRSASDIAGLLLAEMGALEREELRVVLLDAKNHVLGIRTVYVGNVSSAVVRVGELFRDAVCELASGVVLVHSHPSGDPTPSPDDLHLTAEAIAAGRLLDIDVLDHVVIGGDGFVSLRDRGVVFDRVGLGPRPPVAAEGVRR